MIKTVMYAWHDTIPQEVRDTQWLDDFDFNLLALYHDDKLLAVATDGMEPEDACFYRDLDYIEEWVRMAYEAGIEDGKKQVS